jgi:hypothetical protein
MKKLRLTPLSILTAVFAVAGCCADLLYPHNQYAKYFLAAMLAMAVVVFICDLIFRLSVKTTKRIWIVEGIFIFVAAVLFLLMKHYIKS